MSAYKCPRCTADLRTTSYAGVEIETCPVCEGEWLDAGELREIVYAAEKHLTAEEIDRIAWLNKRVFNIKQLTQERLPCPKCPGQKLRPFNYACGSGIILDKCPACGGIWLDRGELELVQAIVREWNGHVSRDPILREKQTTAKIFSHGGTPEATDRFRSPLAYALAVLKSFIQST